ncbi:ATP-dependent DNA helicase PIF1 [Linum perenne]
MGGKEDNSINNGRSPYIYSFGGQIFHRIGLLIPAEGKPPQFAQLYVHDTEHELERRQTLGNTNIGSSSLHMHIMETLRDMFDEHNGLARAFRYARNRLDVGDVQSVKLKLLASRSSDGREYDLPSLDGFACLIVEETRENTYQPDIVVQHLSNTMQRVSYCHPSLMALEYPILFPYGEDGWHANILVRLGSTIYGDSEVTAPTDILVQHKHDPVIDIVDATYNAMQENYENKSYFAERAVLAPLHETVSLINDYMLTKLNGDEVCCYSSDTIQTDGVQSNDDEAEFPTEILNSMKIGNFPEHQLKLKVGAPVILLRTIDQSTGLCNGTRMIIQKLGTWSIEVEVVTGSHIGDRVHLPRMTLASHQKSLNFTLLRRQYPIALCFGMTINKSQGQTLNHVGICMYRQVCTHGQLYVALS